MEYLIFIENKEYEQGSLQEHITYLENSGGTPDCWSSAYSVEDAIKEANSYTGGKAKIYDYYAEEFLDL